MNSAPALISIVMPVRNAAATVRRAVESILAQTWREWELLAVDDGSTDETPEILASFSRTDSRVRLVSTPPRGIATALQTACEASRGEWIARMDGDDWMHPERLAVQREFARENPDLGVVSCLVRYGGDAPGYAAHVDWLNRLLAPEEISLRRFIEAPVAHPSVMFRRDLIDKHGGYRDGDFPEDYELWLRWLEAGVRFGKAPRELMEWSDPPDRLSRTDPRYAVECFYQTKCGYLARWLRANVDPARKLWLWGAGRVTRRRFDALEQADFRFEGFIDVDAKKANRHRDGRRVVMADALPDRESAFVIVGVGNRGARELIAAHLTARGWREGRDFLLAA
jgi:glycosyltransferase involved in cell wall biosynthesis